VKITQKSYLGFIIAVPVSATLLLLPFDPGILPLETLFDRFGEIPAYVYMACLWFFYLLCIPAALAGALNRLSLLRGVCVTYLLAFVALGVLYSRTDGPDLYFRILVCVFAPSVLCIAYLFGHGARHYITSFYARRHQVA